MSIRNQRVMKDRQTLEKDKSHGIIVTMNDANMLIWDVLIPGPSDTVYQNCYFPVELRFPKDYPMSPPVLKFKCSMYHPNIYPSGEVCISILHPAGDDPNHYEHASERWSPAQSAQSILLSVMSILADPNCESPANVDAGKLYREKYEEYNARVTRLVSTLMELPEE